MRKSSLKIVGLIVLLLSLMAVSVIHAQDVTTQISYYTAADADGIWQVYQQLLGTDAQDARQITHAAADVNTYGAAYDGLSIAYISENQLWLQPIHTEEAEALADVNNGDNPISAPVYSQDGQYIAYASNGVWMVDLATRETRELLSNTLLEPDANNSAEFTLLNPEVFVAGSDGKAAQLIVDMGVWEWNTVGVYDLATGTLQKLEGQFHTDLLTLSNGKVLLFGNSRMGGESALHIADSLSDINTYTEAVRFADITTTNLHGEQAVEIQPGIVRVTGQAFDENIVGATVFYFDYDVNADTASEVHLVTWPEGTDFRSIAGEISPDGTLLPVYLDSGTDVQLELVNVTTDEVITMAFPEKFGNVRWQPKG